MGSIQWKHLNLCHTLFPREPKLFLINYLIDLQSPCVRFRIIISFSSWHPVCRRAINITFWCLWCGPEDSCQWNSCCGFNLWEKPWSTEMKFVLTDCSRRVSQAHPPAAPACMKDYILCPRSLLPSAFSFTNHNSLHSERIPPPEQSICWLT